MIDLNPADWPVDMRAQEPGRATEDLRETPEMNRCAVRATARHIGIFTWEILFERQKARMRCHGICLPGGMAEPAMASQRKLETGCPRRRRNDDS